MTWSINDPKSAREKTGLMALLRYRTVSGLNAKGHTNFCCRRADGSNGVKSNKTLSDGYPELPVWIAGQDRRRGSLFIRISILRRDRQSGCYGSVQWKRMRNGI